jgi:hypothetical protein
MSIKCQNYKRPELNKLHKHTINLEMPVGIYHVIGAVNFICRHFNYFRVFHLMMTVLQLNHVQLVIQTSLLIYAWQLILIEPCTNILTTQPR